MECKSGKIVHKTEQEARIVAEKSNRSYYKCPFCFGWHTTRQDGFERGLLAPEIDKWIKSLNRRK